MPHANSIQKIQKTLVVEVETVPIFPAANPEESDDDVFYTEDGSIIEESLSPKAAERLFTGMGGADECNKRCKGKRKSMKFASVDMDWDNLPVDDGKHTGRVGRHDDSASKQAPTTLKKTTSPNGNDITSPSHRRNIGEGISGSSRACHHFDAIEMESHG
jgi:hypothetical protein